MEGEGRGMGMGGRKWSVGLKSLRMIPPERGEQNDLLAYVSFQGQGTKESRRASEGSVLPREDPGV